MRKIGIFLFILSGCSIGMNMDKDGFKPDFSGGPPTMVYKTRADYSSYVPVLLSDDKSRIISYPAPSDLFVGGKYTVPTPLKEGYLLDNRGINQNVAYLKLSYREYSNFKEVPSTDALYKMIIDKDPLTELCDCGNRHAIKNPEKALNKLIRKGKLRKDCRVIK
jgi:hypothetical protein